MNCWRSTTEDEMIVESTILAEICLIHHWIGLRQLDQNTTLLFVKCNTSTLYEISKKYAIKISGLITRNNRLIIFENKYFLSNK